MKLFTLFFAIVTIWLGVLCPAYAQHDEQQMTYTGQIGKSPVVVELITTDANEVTGRYFYLRYRKDIALTGTQSEGGSFELYENENLTGKQKAPKITLTPTPEGGLSGQWHDDKAKTINVSLLPAIIPVGQKPELTPYQNELSKDNLYDYLRLLNMPLKAENEQEFMGYRIRWWKEPGSGIRMFELLSGYPQEQMAQVNVRLRDRLWREVVDYHGCMLGGLSGSSGQADFNQSVKPTYFSPSVISASVFTDYYCGGAHPDFADSPINLDMKSGKELALEDVIWLGKGKPVYYNEQGGDDANFEAFSGYRSTVFAPWIVEQMRKLHPSQMKKSDECDYSTVEYWSFVNWHFTPKGLYFSPSFPRVARACEYPDWSVLPYEVIKTHAGNFNITD
ncbi:hypothetical protein I2494_19370 [Budviciaceae bacterium BWR-B9]|uniref:DUF3298 domain-containing protein n=1 Tax=Limnobaculum allomyrinae TaxID=2791986 RepID=A0ABS1IVY7_9GAMM|nr:MULTISPECIES: hypothetical protein [Limnobaculum]MBK5145832.1 hypothetical protein [Limnobaculum allomyrinae]MBV7694047.1 hypothetical protein [Limnobaculum sp. M2-1]